MTEHPDTPAEPGGDGPAGPDPGAGPPPTTGPDAVLQPWLRSILRCPACGGELADAPGPTGPELQCTGCPLAYRVDEGIPVLLVDEARTRTD